MDRICNACGMKIDENNYLKHRNICKNCHNKNKRRNNNTVIQNDTSASHQQPKVDKNNTNKKIILPEKLKHNKTPNISTYENHRHVVIGPSNVGKTYYMLKILEKMGNQRPICIITRSPNQYPNYKTSNEIKPINNTKDQWYFLMICHELETVLK